MTLGTARMVASMFTVASAAWAAYQFTGSEPAARLVFCALAAICWSPRS